MVRGRVGRELLRHDGIDRQDDLPALGFRLREDGAGGVGEVMLGERSADVLALRRQERVGHAAADDQHVDLGREVAEEIELGRDLGAADDRGERTRGRFQRRLQRRELGLHAAPGKGRERAS